MNQHKLAIVIPAYKIRHLRRSLESIFNQTDHRFNLYVGDDGSPEPIGDVIREFQNRRPFTYHRFNENLGHRSLVGHWHRCIEMSHEPWVWLFSDDDEIEPDCVAAFYQTLQDTGSKYNVYRFNVTVIDNDSKNIALDAPHPKLETWQEYAYFCLRGLRHTIAQAFIFSRASYIEANGFPDFPLAWASDEAGLIAFTGKKEICLIEKSKVQFRNDGQNISSNDDPKQAKAKLVASKLYVQWFLNYLSSHEDPSFLLTSSQLSEKARAWYLVTMKKNMNFCSPVACFKLGKFISDLWGESLLKNCLMVGKWNLAVVYRRIKRMFPW